MLDVSAPECLIHAMHIRWKISVQDYRIGTARKMSLDVDATPDLLLLIQQKLRIVQYRYDSLSNFKVCDTTKKIPIFTY